MKICVIGTGYVGLGGSVLFADWGHEVVGVDVDQAKVALLTSGKSPIYEEGLAEMLTKTLESGNLRFTTDLKEGLENVDIIFICVGTPMGADGSANLKYVREVAKQIGESLDHYAVVVTKSTVPVGTNELVESIIKESQTTPVEFDVASNPEFLREGSAVDDMTNPDRTVIGSNSQKALGVLRKLYSHMQTPVVECDLRSAEMIKYAANSFLATKITFINELSQMCEWMGADIRTVAKGMGLDTRIGGKFLNAGIGYGGSCFPKDVSALYRMGLNKGYNFKILHSVLIANELQRDYFVNKTVEHFGEDLSGKTFGVLGLAFKNNTDDIRESVAIKIARNLRGRGAKLKVYDPEAMENSKKTLGDSMIEYANSDYEALQGVDAFCILTEWKQFGELDLSKVASVVKGKVIFDGRNMLSSQKAAESGFDYYSIGEKPYLSSKQ